jgi:hypothetical protein
VGHNHQLLVAHAVAGQVIDGLEPVEGDKEHR